MRSLLVSLALLTFSAAVRAQQSGLPPEVHQFDFWVGDWKCSGESYSPDGKTEHTECTNHITKELGGRVVEENFHTEGFNGKSVSVYDVNAKIWRQTWVDDGGAYLSFTGGWKDGKMTLATQPGPKGRISHMVFTNIQPDSFDWNWESSTDGGKTWKLKWHLRYTRS
jgi:hypothetical protein